MSSSGALHLLMELQSVGSDYGSPQANTLEVSIVWPSNA